MKVIRPMKIDADALVSSTVAEPDTSETEWVSGTTYAIGDTVIRTTTHRQYRRLSAGAGTTPPETDVTATTPVWEDYAPTVKWAMFDNAISTLTKDTDTLTVVIDAPLVNSLSLLELVGNDVDITITNGDGGPTVYSESVSLDTSAVTDWYSYFFEPFTTRQTVVLTDLPPYTAARVTITLTGVGTVSVGQCILGTVFPLGETQYGASAGIRDYSRKLTDDETGVVTLEVRKFAKLLRARFQLDEGAVNAVHQVITSVRATPVVWISDNDAGLDPLIVFGWFRDFSLDVAFPRRSYYSIEIEGMT